MTLEKKQLLDVQEIRRMLRRRRWAILLPLVVTLGASGLGVFLTGPTYRSTATLALETPVPLTRTVAQAAGRIPHNEGLRVLRERIGSSPFLESVALQVGLHRNPHLIERAEMLARENPNHDKRDLLLRECARVLNAMIDVRADGYDLLYVHVESKSPELAHAVASSVAEQYIQTTRQVQLRQSEEAYTFAQEQMSIYERKLEEKRRQLREFEQEIALKPLSSSPVSAANLGRVNTLITRAGADLQLQRDRHQSARARIVEAGLEAFLNLGALESSKLQALKQTLLELEGRLALTLVEYEEGAAPAASARGQIAVKSQQLLSELESLAAHAFPSVGEESRRLLVDHEYTRIRHEGAAKRKRVLEEFLDKYAADLANMPAEEFRLARLREEVESANRLYQTWLEQANSTQIAKAVQSASMGNQIALIDPPRLPLHPVAPKKNKILGLSLVMGLLLGIGAAVVMELLDLTFKSVEEIQGVLGVPILGAVPRMQAAVFEDIQVRRRKRLQVVVPSVILMTLGLLALALWYFLVPLGIIG